MNQHDEQWLDEQLFRAIHTGEVEFDSEQWQQKYPEEYALLSAAGSGGRSAPDVERQASWRIIMSSKVTKFAIAAALILAIGVGMIIMGGPDMPKVAWADVPNVLKNIEALKHKIKMTVENFTEGTIDDVDMVIYRSKDYGIRRDAYKDGVLLAQMFIPAGSNEVIELMPHDKLYVQGKLSEKILEEARKTDFAMMVSDLMEMDYVEIGGKTIKGVEAEGIEFVDPKFGAYMFENGTGELWVDPQTNLPILLTAEGDTGDGSVHVKLSVDQFEFSTELDAADFEPVIPADYRLLANVDASGTEESAIAGLRGYAQLCGGKYPSSLAIMSASQEISEVLGAKMAAGGAEREPTLEEVQQILGIQATCLFVGEKIGDDIEVAYYGETVTAADVDKVLLRWQVGEDEYRVIFGDLRAETVDGKRLAELEGRSDNLIT